MTPVFRIGAVLAGLVVGLAVATAQPSSSQPNPGAGAPAVMPVAPDVPPPPAEDPAQATYREGYAALVAGDFTTARAKLTMGATMPAIVVNPHNLAGELILSVYLSQQEQDWLQAQELLESGAIT